MNCVGIEDTFVCDPPGDVIGEFTIPRPEGSPDSIGTDRPFSHLYSVESSASLTSDEFFNDVVNEVVIDPTPGNDSPATPGGTVNDAGISPFPNSDNVISFTTTDSNGNPVVANLTIPGQHLLVPGIVSQGIRREGGRTIITAVGEGNGILSIPTAPIARQVFQQKIDGDFRAAIFKDSQR